MDIIDNVPDMQRRSLAWKQAGETLALVPTSGALHPGHTAQVRQAREWADRVVLSVFLNPREFGTSEEFDRYPREPDSDQEKAEAAGVDVLFRPATHAMIGPRFATSVEEHVRSKGLCGVSRPHYFKGVATGVVLLLNAVWPDRLVFSRHHAQTAAVVEQVVNDLGYPTTVHRVDTVRDSDGMAFSPRNRFLSPEQRRDAVKIYQALQGGKAIADQGIRSVDRIMAEVTHLMSQSRRIRVIYVSLVDPLTMQPLKELKPGESLLVVAAWVDQIRLIDNILL
ncbi:MAG: pantoate--beta-alanine ligase [Opitutales bacterium]